MVTNGDMIIGNQPALDVDAIIRQQQGVVRGPGENGQVILASHWSIVLILASH